MVLSFAAGVSAFQAPGKRHKAHVHEPGATNGHPLTVQLPEAFQTPRPAGLPHLKVPTPGTGGAKATMESSTAAPVTVSPGCSHPDTLGALSHTAEPGLAGSRRGVSHT